MSFGSDIINLQLVISNQRRKLNMEAITLNNLAIGQKATIITVGGEGILRRRFLDMGLTPKTRVMVRKRAPLGDPIEIFLRGYELTLRLDDAKKITVQPEEA
jgi:ferrous iron transport protein A